MKQSLAHVALLVREYDEAIAYFTGKLGFVLVEDTDLGNGKRWVLVTPRGPAGAAILLARAANGEQAAYIGKHAGGRVGWFLYTDDFERDYDHMKRHGVEFIEAPRHEPYGTVVVFRDLYGNKWDLVQRTEHET